MDQLYSPPAPQARIAPRATQVSPADALPADPARVNPCHLPALAHVAADLDGIDAPVKVVDPAQLGACADCPDGALDELDAVATVVAYTPDGERHEDDVCVLHLHGAIRDHTRHQRPVVVEVPATGGRRSFEQTPQETFYATNRDRESGVAVVRGIWDARRIVDVVEGFAASRELCPVGLRDGESFNACRARAEMLAQAVASVRAADAHEAPAPCRDFRAAQAVAA